MHNPSFRRSACGEPHLSQRQRAELSFRVLRRKDVGICSLGGSFGGRTYYTFNEPSLWPDGYDPLKSPLERGTIQHRRQRTFSVPLILGGPQGVVPVGILVQLRYPFIASHRALRRRDLLHSQRQILAAPREGDGLR